MRFHSHLHTAVSIIEKYNGQEPLAVFLKKFFAADKKYGSGDRRNISALCYAYYRLGKTMMDDGTEERIIKAVFLCRDQPLPFLAALRPEWNDRIHLPLGEKWNLCGMAGEMTGIFPWHDILSEAIDVKAFNSSFLRQPDLFLRVRPGRETVVEEQLNNAGIAYQWVHDHAIALPNASKIEEVIHLNKDAVVQDLRSQSVLDALPGFSGAFTPPIKVWDCCAASGGKSILLQDRISQKIDLTVSDIRQSILANLSKRFAEAGIRGYRPFVADLSSADTVVSKEAYDLIICDAPCTGSGTWSRTPEQLYFFNTASIDSFSSLQKKITGNIIPALKEGGILVYITCSVFRQENEDITAAVSAQYPFMKLLEQKTLPGYTERADTMFAAFFRKATS